jgi:hypothetical protein
MELSKPLTLEEVQEAADIFLPLYEEVYQRLRCVHQNPSLEDTLKVMEHVCKLAQQQRVQTKLDRFGFNKEQEDADLPSS